MLAWREGDPINRRSLSVLWDRADNKAYEAIVDLAEDGVDSVVSFDHVPGVTPELHGRRVARLRRRDEGRSPGGGRAGRARAHRPRPGAASTSGPTARALMPEKYRDRRLGWADIWVRSTPTGNPYAQPGLRHQADRRHEHDGAAGDRPGRLGRRARPGDGRVRTGPGPRSDPAHRHQAAGDHPAGRPVVRGRRQRDPLAELVVPAGVQLPGGPGHPPGHVQRPRHGAGHRLPHVVRRDDRALPGSQLRPLPPHRLRHRRVGPRLHDDIARARLRLSRRDPLSGRGSHRQPGRAVDHRECHLPARGGQRRAVEARRLGERPGRGAPGPPDGGVDPRHRRQLRVPRLLALLPGRQHRVRGAGHRDHGHHADSPRAHPTPPTGTLVDHRTYAPFHQHFLVARLDLDVDGQNNTVLEIDSMALPVGPDNPYGLAVVDRGDPDRVGIGVGAGLRLGHASGPGKWSTRTSSTAIGTPVGYKLVPGAAFPVMMDPRRRSSCGRR